MNPRIAQSLARHIPPRLRSRLACTMVAANLVAVGVMATGALIGVRYIQPVLEQDQAQSALDQISQGLREQSSSLHASSAVLGTASRIYEASHTETMPADLVTTLDAYSREINADAVLFLGNNSSRVYAYGPQPTLAFLESAISLNRLAPGDNGPLFLDDTSVTVSVREVVGSEKSAEPGGVIVVARAIDPSAIELDGRLSLADPEASAGIAGGGRTVSHAHFDDVVITSDDGSYLLEAEVPGVDGSPAATVLYTDSVDLTALSSILKTSTLLAMAVSILVGVGTGLTVAAAIARPINQLSDHIAKKGAARIRGDMVEPVRNEGLLPTEFGSLIDEYNLLLESLSAERARATQSHEKLLEAKNTLDVVVRDSTEGKLLVENGTLSVLNPAARAHLSITDPASTAPLVDVLASLDLRNPEGQVIEPESLIAHSLVSSVRVGVRGAGGATRWLELHAVAHEDHSTTVLLTTRDITEDMRLEELRTEIIGLVSHDLRAPLSVISGYLDILSRELDLSSRDRAIASAQKAVVRMQDLLEDLLSATRAEEYFAPTGLERVSIKEIAEETVSSLSLASSHHLSIDASCDAQVMGEERRLRQVIVNLVTNAMKYAPRDTKVTLRIECDEDKLVFSVEDEGPGVPEADRETIFKRFTRLKSPGAATRPGVGLGLYIARTIIEGHGGSVWVEDASGGNGARFVVTLPLAPDGP